MSTVLWANVLIDGAVVSDETDHAALYTHADKLDAITKALQLPPFLAICDTTDQRFNLDDTELSPGMTSTNELMAVDGAWMPMSSAMSYLRALRDHIVARNVRFGLFTNQHVPVVAELDAVLAFASAQAPRATQFNFSIVM
jgi:hypothetical protein